jgi:hypothetical protein
MREHPAVELGVPMRQLLKPQEGLLGDAFRAEQMVLAYWK